MVNEAEGINDRGQVTGFAIGGSNQQVHAFLYTNGSMMDLGTLGGSSSTGLAVDSHGVVTGGASTASDIEHAFVGSSGKMRDLNEEIGSAASLYTLVEGEAINDKGRIVVNGIINQTSTQAAFLLTPVP